MNDAANWSSTVPRCGSPRQPRRHRIVWAQTGDGIQGLCREGMAGFAARSQAQDDSARSVTSSFVLRQRARARGQQAAERERRRVRWYVLTQARYGITGADRCGQLRACTGAWVFEARIRSNRPLPPTRPRSCGWPNMARRIKSAQLLSLQLGRLKGSGRMAPTQVSLAKGNTCRMGSTSPRLPRPGLSPPASPPSIAQSATA